MEQSVDTGPCVAIADDLTGACEIAGVAWRRGLSATVTLDPATIPEFGEWLVIDSETRLLRPLDAARTLTTIGNRLADRPVAFLYKKTDSVLRGPVAAELEALVAAHGFDRVLLVPGNPGLGRLVREGRLTIDGVPLHQTPFAHDPHHPARSDHVIDLLGPTTNLAVRCAAPSDPLEDGTLTVGNAASPADLDGWARRLSLDTLAAGGAAWFDAILANRGHDVRNQEPAPSTDGPVLLLSGTTAGPQRERVASSPYAELLPMEELDQGRAFAWLQRVQLRLNRHGRACVGVHGAVAPERAAQVRAALAAAGLRAVRDIGVHHLVIEGGATAAAVLRVLKWQTLRTCHVWSPGVVTLCPLEAPDRLITLKPGSYPWPESLQQLLFGAHPVS
ncbi:MAG TPA: four-carbon acid sugar kinase family protein [Candidatus Synoicihabitans sp.]|nr:four-carbon acid sugar kinase family protein [Candidatus Synoicihabitans sp.]